MARTIESAPAAVSKSKREFITTVSQFKHSVRVPDEYLGRYWSLFEPRFNKASDEEVKFILEFRQEMIDYGFPMTRSGAISHIGGMSSFMIPEGDPSKVINIAAISDMAFIEDDLQDGEIFWPPHSLVYGCAFPQKEHAFRVPDRRYVSKAELFKEWYNIVQQMKAKIQIEALDQDEDGIRYIEACEAWIFEMAEVDCLRGYEFSSIEDYMDSKLHTVGGLGANMLLHYCYSVKLTAEELAPLQLLREQAIAHGTYGNDWVSAEIEWVLYVTEGRLDLPHVNSVFVIMHTMDVTFAEAKDILVEKVLEKERQFINLRLKLEENASEAVKEYTSACQMMAAGSLAWHIHNPRYYVHPNHPFYPKPEYKISDYTRLVQANRAANQGNETDKDPSVQELSVRTTSGEYTNGSHTNGDHMNGYHIVGDHNGENKVNGHRTSVAANGEAGNKLDIPAWISSYPKLSDEIVSEPYNYISSLPSKKIRDTAINALDSWYRVPQQSLDVIISVINLLHSSSLIVDDIEDNSPLRRGQPAAHMVFGTPQAINAANYLFVRCLDEIQKLSPVAVRIFTDELRNLHVGQSLDLYWSFHTECPSEAEYIRMIDGKTGGLFRLASRLMKAHATQNQNLDVDDLLNLMGRYFQIRDDYQNLCSSDYTAAKGTLSDLDEGKYSFMLIHALNNTKNKQLKSLLQLRARNNSFTMEQKNLIMKYMTKAKSLEYTKRVLSELYTEIHTRLESIESDMDPIKGKNWILRVIMARLRVDEVHMHQLSTDV